MIHRTLFLSLFLLLLLAGRVAAQTDCASCHEQGATVAKSAHADVSCARCHPKHEKYPHPPNVPKTPCASCHATEAGEHARSVHGEAMKSGNEAAPDCGMCHGGAHEVQRTEAETFHRAVPDTCGMCHTDISEQFKASVHGQAVSRGVGEAPVCTDCHGEHNILSPKDVGSTVHPMHIRETCGSCHDDVRLNRRFNLPRDRVVSFDASFHGLASAAGSQTVANCASCHGIHNILPSSDPKAMTHVKNLPNTCGQCHPGAGTRFALGTIHWVEGSGEPAPVRVVRVFYLIIIPATLGFMLLHHFGDWVRKLLRMRIQAQMAPPPPATLREAEVRMFGFERIQHALLLVSFGVLVWSGFALKYPDQWWARPLIIGEAQYPFRGTVHRTAAVVMVAVSILHVISLVASRRLREHWLHLFPRAADVKQAFGVLFYNLGLRSAKPQVSSHSYVEKLEYWAVVWGTFIMALTGFVLWFNNWALAYLPKEWIDVATAVHWYEAVLATAAIVIWHFYTVIFDPDVYPMDTAWLTGRSVRRRRPEHDTSADEQNTQHTKIEQEQEKHN
jgi:cytochrome b subunit of formate dehydrogenase